LLSCKSPSHDVHLAFPPFPNLDCLTILSHHQTMAILCRVLQHPSSGHTAHPVQHRYHGCRGDIEWQSTFGRVDLCQASYSTSALMMHAILVRSRVPETSASASHVSRVDFMPEHLLICTLELILCLLEHRLICLVPGEQRDLEVDLPIFSYWHQLQKNLVL